MKKIVLIGAMLLGISHASWAMENDIEEDSEGWMVVEKNGDATRVATPHFVSLAHSPSALSKTITDVMPVHSTKNSPKIVAHAISELSPKTLPLPLLNAGVTQDDKDDEVDMPALENGENNNALGVVHENEQSISSLNVWVKQCAQWLILTNAVKDKEENKERTVSTFTALMAFSDWSAYISND